MHKNSLGAWHGEVKPTLRKRQLQVLKVMQRLERGTARDVMSATGQTSNVIHPRLGELRDLEYLKEVGDKKIDGRNHTIYALTEKGLNTDTSKVADIEPKTKYYSKDDVKVIARRIYNHIKTNHPADSFYVDSVYEDMKSYIATLD